MTAHSDFDVVYRGLRWQYAAHGELRISCLEDGHLTEIRHEYGEFKQSDLFLLWPAMLRSAQSFALIVHAKASAVDGIPWIIHQIEDEDAYDRALTAYKLGIGTYL